MVVINYDSGDGGDNYYTEEKSRVGIVWSGVMRKGVRRFKKDDPALYDKIAELIRDGFLPLKLESVK